MRNPDRLNGWEAVSALPGTHYRWHMHKRQKADLSHGIVRRDLVGDDGICLAELQAHRDHALHTSNPAVSVCRIATLGRNFETRIMEPGKFSVWKYGMPTATPVREVVDIETQAPILRVAGAHWNHHDGAVIEMVQGRRLTCSVSGNRVRKSVMAVTDESGDWVMRFRWAPTGRRPFPGGYETLVAPGQPITAEMACAMAVGLQQYLGYFSKDFGGA